MKIYTKKPAIDCSGYDHPDEMAKILGHLNLGGTLRASGYTVERLYREFSDEKYAAGWMTVSPEILEEFADWLAAIDL